MDALPSLAAAPNARIALATVIAEGFGAHVPKGHIHAAMAFSALVEGLDMMSPRRARRRRGASASAHADC